MAVGSPPTVVTAWVKCVTGLVVSWDGTVESVGMTVLAVGTAVGAGATDESGAVS